MSTEDFNPLSHLSVTLRILDAAVYHLQLADDTIKELLGVDNYGKLKYGHRMEIDQLRYGIRYAKTLAAQQVIITNQVITKITADREAEASKTSLPPPP